MQQDATDSGIYLPVWPN